MFPFSVKQVLFFVVVALAIPVMPLSAQDEHDHDHAAADAIPIPLVRGPKIPNYTRFKRQFSEICEAVGADLRREKLYELLLSISERNTECVACRPLIGVFASACKPPAVRPKKPKPTPEKDTEEGEDSEGAEEAASPLPTPRPATKQREPNLVVIDRISELGRDLAAVDDGRPELVKAVDRLTIALSAHPSFTPAELEYFSIMAEYLKAPFVMVPREESVGSGNETKESKPLGNVDDLFDQ